MLGCSQLSERKGLLKKNSKLKVVPKKIRPDRANFFGRLYFAGAVTEIFLLFNRHKTWIIFKKNLKQTNQRGRGKSGTGTGISRVKAGRGLGHGPGFFG